jgi:hypothetical protein
MVISDSECPPHSQQRRWRGVHHPRVPDFISQLEQLRDEQRQKRVGARADHPEAGPTRTPGAMEARQKSIAAGHGARRDALRWRWPASLTDAGRERAAPRSGPDRRPRRPTGAVTARHMSATSKAGPGPPRKQALGIILCSALTAGSRSSSGHLPRRERWRLAGHSLCRLARSRWPESPTRSLDTQRRSVPAPPQAHADRRGAFISPPASQASLASNEQNAARLGSGGRGPTHWRA